MVCWWSMWGVKLICFCYLCVELWMIFCQVLWWTLCSWKYFYICVRNINITHGVGLSNRIIYFFYEMAVWSVLETGIVFRHVTNFMTFYCIRPLLSRSSDIKSPGTVWLGVTCCSNSVCIEKACFASANNII